jgi:hypothetical protein
MMRVCFIAMRIAIAIADLLIHMLEEILVIGNQVHNVSGGIECVGKIFADVVTNLIRQLIIAIVLNCYRTSGRAIFKTPVVVWTNLSKFFNESSPVFGLKGVRSKKNPQNTHGACRFPFFPLAVTALAGNLLVAPAAAGVATAAGA